MERRREGGWGCVLGPLDGEHQVIITKTVESLDGLGTILPASGKKQTQRQSAAKNTDK
jgi:hypothetical protein